MRISVLLLVVATAVASDALYITLGRVMGNGFYGGPWSNVQGASMVPASPGMGFSPMNAFQLFPASSGLQPASTATTAAAPSSQTLTSTIKINGQKMRCVCTPVNEPDTNTPQPSLVSGIFTNGYAFRY